MAGPRYLPRSWWADSDWRRGGAQLVDDDLHRLGNVCHYPGRTSPFGRLSLASLRNNLRGWWNYHVNTRGWSDIGYQVAVAHTSDGPVVVDLRGIGRVPAAHASTSNPRANWHGGATLWVVGNTEPITHELIDSYRHFRTTVWLPRWPTAKGVTGHRRVPGASTGCPGDPIIELVDSGALIKPPDLEDDMPTAKEIVDEFERRKMGEYHTGVDITGQRGVAGGARYAYLASTKLNDVRANQAKQLTELAAIKAKVGAGDVDMRVLAQELMPLLAPVLVEELADIAALTEQQVEAAQERVLRRVLGSLNT